MKSKLYNLPLFFIAALLFTASCKKEYESIEEIDTRNIENYLGNDASFKKLDSLGTRYKVIKPGSGADLKYSEIIPLVFTVRSLDGSYVAADTFAVSNRYGAYGLGYTSNEYLGYFGTEKGYPSVLKTAVVEILKKRGGEIRVIVPSKLAYGRNGYGQIPGNASLDYDIRVINEKEIDSYDDIAIKKYMAANNLSGFDTVKSDKSILYYKIIEAGTGSSISVDSTVTTQYTGKLFNGTVFDQTTDSNTATFVLSSVIPGWQKGIPKIKEGGTIRLLVPSSLAYGLGGSRAYTGLVSIPPASCLDFQVKVTDVTVTAE